MLLKREPAHQPFGCRVMAAGLSTTLKNSGIFAVAGAAVVDTLVVGF